MDSSDDDTSVPIKFYTHVLWDVVDFPVPTDPAELRLVYGNIDEALHEECYGYDKEYEFYGGRFDDDDVDTFPGKGYDKRTRVRHRMLTDILYWARDYPKANHRREIFKHFLIIAKGLEDDEDVLYVLKEMSKRGHLISLVVPDDYHPLEDLLPQARRATKGVFSIADSVWRWKVLCDGGEAIEPDSDIHKETSLEVERRMMDVEEEEIIPPEARVTNMVYFDVKIGGKEAGRIVMGLFGELMPKTVQHFRAMCTGSDVWKSYQPSTAATCSASPAKKPIVFKPPTGDLSYKGTRLIMKKGCSIQGEIKFRDWDDELRAYFAVQDPIFAMEAKNSDFLKQTGPGILSMHKTNTVLFDHSLFYICTTKKPKLGDEHVVFGQVIQGMKLVRRIESQPLYLHMIPTPKKECIIYDCGELPMEA